MVIKDVQNSGSKETVPTGVKIIAVLYYISAALMLISIATLFVIGSKISELVSAFPALSILSNAAMGIIIVISIILFGFAVLEFFIGRGLWKGQNWARIVAIIFTIIGLLMALLSLFGGAIVKSLIPLVIGGFIAYYLMFNDSVKSAFK